MMTKQEWLIEQQQRILAALGVDKPEDYKPEN